MLQLKNGDVTASESATNSEVLVFEFGSVDRLSAGSVALCEISSLDHELGDDSVEGGALEAETLLSCAQTTEILRC